MTASRRGKNGAILDEFAWKDRDRAHGRVIGYDEVRLEQSRTAFTQEELDDIIIDGFKNWRTK